jgi:hypothetical protein
MNAEGTFFSQDSIQEEEKTIMPRTCKTSPETKILFVASNNGDISPILANKDMRRKW